MDNGVQVQKIPKSKEVQEILNVARECQESQEFFHPGPSSKWPTPWPWLPKPLGNLGSA